MNETTRIKWIHLPVLNYVQLAGALAEEGRSLKQIVSKIREVLQGIGELFFSSESLKFCLIRVNLVDSCFAGTLGVSLSPCSVPGCLPSFDLPPGAMELGLGEGR